ncbi:MAG TPA: OmpA family protein [Deltaproteobacteria bacterium]|nr:OmpA family protein [Deltaproteobacteria bacterium]HPR53601.1 OmpA family protein [Deltaproteobacteria bacterium]HXK47116.1 OmpA family protein [Deltaproteobacteria bacterium]
MKRIFTFFLALAVFAGMLGCAHRHTEEEYRAVQAELGACRKQYEESQAEKTRLENDLKESLRKLEKASEDITAGYSNKQDLLDSNIECMDENRALLKQLSKFKVITQERKDAEWRLNKASDNLVEFLASERMNDQLYIVKAENAVKVIIPQRSLFPASSSAWLMPKGAVLIKKIAKGVEGLKPLTIAVAGHTDGVPLPRAIMKTYPSQWDLGFARAVSVLLALENAGIARDKLSAVSYGDTRPIADTNTEEGKAMNRRVEIVITP